MQAHKIGSIAVNNLAAQSFGLFDFKAPVQPPYPWGHPAGYDWQAAYKKIARHVRSLFLKTISNRVVRVAELPRQISAAHRHLTPECWSGRGGRGEAMLVRLTKWPHAN